MKYLKTFENINNERKTLYYYAFDWDDNILIMPTVIHMETKIENSWTPIDISTTKFSEIRNDLENWRYPNNDPEKAYSNFRDKGPLGTDIFKEDVIKAIDLGNYGPSWNDFIECLINGCIFAIITARGHEPETIRKGIEWIIDNKLNENQLYNMYNHLIEYTYRFDMVENNFDRILKGQPSKNILIKKYLNNCDFIGVSSASNSNLAATPEEAKKKALIEFNKKINNYAGSIGLNAKIGFSDDDLKNVEHIQDLFMNLNKEKFLYITEYTIINTKNPKNVTKKRITNESTASNQAPGLQTSVLTCTQFGNMTSTLYPEGPDQRQDDFANQLKRRSKYLAKTSDDILGDKKRKRKKKRKNNSDPTNNPLNI